MQQIPFKVCIALLALFSLNATVRGQVPSVRYGTKVPADVRLIYGRGLQFLAQSQRPDGSWMNGQHGITGLCVMAFLASGEDPNFGRYSLQIRKAVRAIVLAQNARTGYFGNSMYHHGFAMLGLSEAYGTVDESLIWTGTQKGKRSIAKALELGVRCAVTAQKKNSWGGWRYSPDGNSADTSVSGAVLMGLLAARNAGVKIPDTCIDRGLKYFRSSTSKTGMVAYSGGVGGFGESMNRSSIGTLVFAIGKQKKWDQYKSALGHITTRLEHQEPGYPFYFRYYMAQALFQGDFDSWKKWNRETIRLLKGMQSDKGSFQGGHGEAYATSMSLLALALNYRFLPIYER
jgi:hypothetical protein